MSVDALIKVLPPPATPVDASAAGGWTDAETRLGAPLPDDYRAFVERYGTGRIANFMSVTNPFSRKPRLNMFEHVTSTLETLRELRDSGEEYPYPLFPERGGVLPFGQTDNGDVFYWVTRGLPNEWTVAVMPGRDPDWEHHDMNMTTFLTGLLSGTVKSEAAPSLARSPTFVPYEPSA